MRLVRDHSAGAYAVRVPCLACGMMLELSEALIDIDGPAFRAYYHEACLSQPVPEVRCDRWDCARCH